MDTDKDVIEAIAERLKEELDIEELRLSAIIIEKLVALELAENSRNK
jgi:hypothetical protein